MVTWCTIKENESRKGGALGGGREVACKWEKFRRKWFKKRVRRRTGRGGEVSEARGCRWLEGCWKTASLYRNFEKFSGGERA